MGVIALPILLVVKAAKSRAFNVVCDGKLSPGWPFHLTVSQKYGWPFHLTVSQKYISQAVINSLRPSAIIWRHRTGSTLDQLMACCLTATSHYLNHCWCIICKVLGIHLRVLSKEDQKIQLSKTRLNTAYLKSHPHLPGANELSTVQHNAIHYCILITSTNTDRCSHL